MQRPIQRPLASRRRFLRGAGGLALAGAGASLFGGCTRIGQGDALEKARESGTIRIGIANEKPFGFMSGGEVTGQAPVVAQEVFRRMGIPNMQARTVAFGALPDQLNNELFDVAAAGMFINAERCGSVLFSDPDYMMQTAFLIRKNSPAEGITGFTDVAKNPEIRLLTMGKIAEYNAAIGQGVPDRQITTGFTVATDAVAALADGRYDALALTRLSLATQLADQPGLRRRLVLSEPFYPEVDGKEWRAGGGYGFRYSDQNLRDAFNDELRAMQQEDAIYPLVKQFGFTRTEIEDAKNSSAEELCAISGDDGRPVKED